MSRQTQQCAKCAASKQADLNARRDADFWVPENPEAWKQADDACFAAHRAKVAARGATC